MPTTLQALILGLVQGLGEFLPISSSAHLVLVPWLLHWKDPGLAFDVALHVGTLIAVLWYFRGEWVALARAAWQVVTTRKMVTVEQRRAVAIIVATIPGAIFGALLEKRAETTFRDPALVAVLLILAGIVLWAVDKYVAQARPITELRMSDGVWIGLAQVFALLPGVSRSGSTITAARALGIDRNGAAAFSFLMSMPIIAGAAALTLLKHHRELLQGGVTAPLVGIAAAAISGWFAISALLRYVSRHSYGAFALYRVILGAIVLAVYFARGG